MPAVTSTHTTARLVVALGLASGCRTTASSTPPPPAPTTDAAPAATPPVRGPDAVVASVDGTDIREADVERRMRLYVGSSQVPPPSRDEVVLQLIERRLVATRISRLGMDTRDEDVDRVMGLVAANDGVTVEQLRSTVESTGTMSWAQYREEVRAQLDEARLLSVQPRMSSSRWYAGVPIDDAERTAARARMLGCLRAGAEVSLADASVTLPANPFANAATFAGVRFTGETAVAIEDLEAAAATAGGTAPLCDAVVDVERELEWFYADRGYLDATVRTVWPAGTGPTEVEVQTVPGPRYMIGAIRLDQTNVPEAARLAEAPLRKRIAALAKPGDVAKASKLQAIVDLVEEAARSGALGTVEPKLERTPARAGAAPRVELVLQVAAAPR